MLYVGCVSRHICRRVCPLSTVLLFAWFPVLYVGCVSRSICGRECVPCPLYNRVFSAVLGVCVTSHLWACVCPPSTVLSLCVAFGRYPGCVSRHYCRCVGVPGHCFSSYMDYISTWYGHYFLISLRSTLLSRTTISPQRPTS